MNPLRGLTAGETSRGNALDRAGCNQKNGEIVVFGNVKNEANKRQAGGVMYIGKNAKNAINLFKKAGDTYVGGSVAGNAGKYMLGGRLFIMKKAKGRIGAGIGAGAEIYIGEQIEGRQDTAVLGSIAFRPFDYDFALKLREKAENKLKELGINPYYHND